MLFRSVVEVMVVELMVVVEVMVVEVMVVEVVVVEVVVVEVMVGRACEMTKVGEAVVWVGGRCPGGV